MSSRLPRAASRPNSSSARREQLNAFERLRGDHESVAALLSQAEVAGDWRLLFWQMDLLHEIGLDEANAALRRWTVAHNRSDVLLRHADTVSAPEEPLPPSAAALVAGKDWPALAQASDPCRSRWPSSRLPCDRSTWVTAGSAPCSCGARPRATWPGWRSVTTGAIWRHSQGARLPVRWPRSCWPMAVPE